MLSIIAKLANSHLKCNEICTLSLQNTAVVNPLTAKGEPSSESSRRLLEKEGPAFMNDLWFHLGHPTRFKEPLVTKHHAGAPTFVLHVALQYQHPALLCEVMVAYFGFQWTFMLGDVRTERFCFSCRN